MQVPRALPFDVFDITTYPGVLHLAPGDTQLHQKLCCQPFEPTVIVLSDHTHSFEDRADTTWFPMLTVVTTDPPGSAVPTERPSMKTVTPTAFPVQLVSMVPSNLAVVVGVGVGAAPTV